MKTPSPSGALAALISLCAFCAFLAVPGSAARAAADTGGEGSGVGSRELIRRLERALEGDSASDSRRRPESLARDARLLVGTIRGNDGVWTATGLVRTAFADRMMTERVEITLETGGEGGPLARGDPGDPGDPENPGIRTRRTVVHTVEDVYRFDRSSETSYRFDGFRFEREGLTMRSGRGTLVTQSRGGYVERIRAHLAGEGDSEFRYLPPLERDRLLDECLREREGNQLVFDPVFLDITCDRRSCERFIGMFRGLEEIRRRKTGTPLKQIVDEDRGRVERTVTLNPFAGFVASDQPGDVRWRIEIAGRSGKGRVALSFDSARGRAVAWSARGLEGSRGEWQTLYTFHAEESRRPDVSPERLERRADRERRDFDVVRLEGVITIAPERSTPVKTASAASSFIDGPTANGTIEADLSWTLRLKRPAVRLVFSTGGGGAAGAGRPDLELDSLADGDGNDLTFVRLGGAGGFIALPRRKESGSLVEIRARIRVRESLVHSNGTDVSVAREGWLPLIAPGAVVPDMDLTISAPEGMRVLAAGRVASDAIGGGRRTTRRVSRLSLGVPVMVVGNFVGVPSENAARRSDGTTVTVAAHAPRLRSGAPAVDKVDLDVAAAEAAEALEALDAITGVRFDPDRFDLVVMPGGRFFPIGAVGPAGTVGSAGPVGEAFGTDGRDASRLELWGEDSARAAAARQWWSLTVAGANRRSGWFPESIAEYSTALLEERAAGRDAYRQRVRHWRRDMLGAGLVASVQDAPVQRSGDARGSRRVALRSKGPSAFHMLRSSYGDQKFFEFMKILARELRGKESVTRDVQKVAESAFGADMEWFFDQWIRGVGVPEYTFEHRVHPSGGGEYLVEGVVEQRVVIGRDGEELRGTYFHGLVPITIELDGGREIRKNLIIERQPRTEFRFRLDQRPGRVVLNKYGETLARGVVES